jgi:hypothetical protein
MAPLCAGTTFWKGTKVGGAKFLPLRSAANRQSIVSMTPQIQPAPTEGALRAASELEQDESRLQATANLIDRATGLRELTEILEEIIAEAGDLLETRSPELVMAARAALRRSSSTATRQAE